MKTLALFALLLSSAALAEEHKLTVGVFLPTTLADGQTRFEFAEAFAASLGTALGRPATGRNFGRYEDFAAAIKEGQLDVAVVDAWAAAQSSAPFKPLALGVVGGQTHQRWAIVARSPRPVKDLVNKRLAISRGLSQLDMKFLLNAVLAGDFDAGKGIKLVPVPSVESALKSVEAKTADAALLPASMAPKNLTTVYRSPKLPGALVLSLKGDPATLQPAVLGLSGTGPFSKYVAADEADLRDLRKTIVSGPPKRIPVMAQSPTQYPDSSALLNLREVGLVLPSFIESLEVSKDQPDD